MNNLNQFDAFKMNKVQMNAILGGKTCFMSIRDEDGTQIYIQAEVPNDMSNDAAAAALHDKYDPLYGRESVIVSKCS